MRVDWAIPCRYAELAPSGGATIVGAGADLFLVPEVPAAVAVTFAVRFVGAPDELDGEQSHPIACRLFDPKGNALGQQAAAVSGSVDQVVPGYAAELTVPMGVVIDAQSFGTYGVEFEIDAADEVARRFGGTEA